MRPDLALSLAALAVLPSMARADPAEIVGAEARADPSGWTVAVTLRHGDTGWEDYADGWRLVSRDGDVLATRALAHPHVDEQPFTRSLSGLDLPQGEAVFVESSTSVTSWSGARFRLPIPPSD